MEEEDHKLFILYQMNNHFLENNHHPKWRRRKIKITSLSPSLSAQSHLAILRNGLRDVEDHIANEISRKSSPVKDSNFAYGGRPSVDLLQGETSADDCNRNSRNPQIRFKIHH